MLLPGGLGVDGQRFLGVPDDNRSAILPETVVAVAGRGYAVSAKGVGARTPLYGETPLDFAFSREFDSRAGDGLAGRRLVASESWFGESPYGAQGEAAASYGLEITELAKGCEINRFHICPVTEVNELPAELVDRARGVYWYRRHRGRFLQEQRLVPSNVRLYHQSEVTLGQAPDLVLEAFGVTEPSALDSFIDAYTASGIAALTVFVRTMRPCPWGVQGLDYANVFLDKDCLVAPDGTLHFADLEGMEWVVAGQDWTVEERVREQFGHNAYEIMYGLDVLLRQSERMSGRTRDQRERREAAASRFEIALAGDPFTMCERSAAGVDLIVRPALGAPDVVVPLVDLR